MSAKKADRWETRKAQRKAGKYTLEVYYAVQLGGRNWTWAVLFGGFDVIAAGTAPKEWQAKLYARRAMEKHAGRGRK